MTHLLDNIVWHALAGPHEKYAVGTNDVRRYSAGFPPVVGFADPTRPNFPALAAYCTAGEQLYCEGWSSDPPDGWIVDAESTMVKMLWEGSMPPADDAPGAVRLGSEHQSQVIELAALTSGGPFGPRTIELGAYYGLFDGERLVAMAGERIYVGPYREISSVCTHPEFQGRGYARRLVTKLVRGQLERGETPILHVMRDNEIAYRLYERLGFREYSESVARVVSKRLPQSW